MTETDIRFEAPDLRRLRYFHGQLLGARDLQREQAYLREKLRLRMRCLLGYGVAHGLFVKGSPSQPRQQEDPTVAGKPGPRKGIVTVTGGLGLDAHGNEVVVPRTCELDLWQLLPPDERGGDRPPDRVWLGVAYHEKEVEPTRTVFTSACADSSDCEYGWTQETYRFVVTAKKPEEDRRCDSCGEDGGHSGGEHPVLWLAVIDELDWRGPIGEERIHMHIRRLFGRRVPTVITGINWKHGHTYPIDEVKNLLGTVDPAGGLRIRFSDEIRTDCLRRGVLDIQVIEGGAGRSADSWFMGGKFEGLPDPDGWTREIRYRQTTRETLQEDDRVHITLRTAFLLDRCCRPVDGTHVGGNVPLIGEHQHRGKGWCPFPSSGIGPWTSGSGAGGDVFESWFFVEGGHR